MTRWLLIAMGGAAGSLLRYALQGWVHRLAGTALPLGTLVVNVLGCLVIGFLAAACAGPISLRDDYRLGLTVGLLGGFTTFSTFGWETFALTSSGQVRWAVANVALSCTLGLLAVWFGARLAGRWFGA